VAEACFNLDFEYIKNRLEVTEGGFSTKHTFELIDLRAYKYLDMDGIQAYMEQYFKTMINTGNLGLNPATVQGTGLYLDTRPKFYKAIMRRLGMDTTKKINYQEFSELLKPCPTECIQRAFGQNLDQSRVMSIMHMQGEL
jgi:hypothetical protein